MKVQCQICQEFIAETDLHQLHVPLVGRMFQSPDARHEVPMPFDPASTWEEMLCPHGRNHRPFISRDKILTDEGIVVLDAQGARIDPDAVSEVGRESIQDRETREPIVSDEEAERQVRDTISGSIKDGVKYSDGSKVPEEFHCPSCSKSFGELKNLNRHMAMAHKDKANG